MEQRAAQRARDRANVARWNLEIAIFLFAIVIIVVILSFQGIGIEIVASVGFLDWPWPGSWDGGREGNYMSVSTLRSYQQEKS